MLLDNRTLLFSLMLVSALMALSLAAVSRRDAGDGLSKWAGALALQALVWLLVAARGVIPDAYSILLANVLMVAAQSLKLAAIHEYLGRKPPFLQCLLPVLLALGVFAALDYDEMRHRLILGSVILATQFLLLLRAVRLDRESRAGRAWRLLFCATALMLPLLALRAIAAWLGTFEFATPYSATAPNPVQLAVFVGVIALDLLGSMGFILLVKERADRALRALAMADPLTKVLNRRAFLDRLEQEFALAARHHLPMALLMIDIDHFKRINDEYGHPAGDRVLVAVAELLAAQLRKQDSLGRLGGEEFCVLLPATDEAGAFRLAEKLRRAVEAQLHPLGEDAIAVTISLGIAATRLDGTAARPDWQELMEAADKALYQAKSSGRNRTVPPALVYPLEQPAA